MMLSNNQANWAWMKVKNGNYSTAYINLATGDVTYQLPTNPVIRRHKMRIYLYDRVKWVFWGLLHAPEVG